MKFLKMYLIELVLTELLTFSWRFCLVVIRRVHTLGVEKGGLAKNVLALMEGGGGSTVSVGTP